MPLSVWMRGENGIAVVLDDVVELLGESGGFFV
jgi:hypothetical protein